jgi:hypothetical protein
MAMELLTEEQAYEAILNQELNGTPTLDRPIPEALETVLSQIKWLIEGKRKAVYLPNDSAVVQLPHGMQLFNTSEGKFYYNPKLISMEEIEDAVRSLRIGFVLGYGIGQKPAYKSVIGAVVIRDSNGLEKQSVLTDRDQLSKVYEAAKLMKDESDFIRFENQEKVIEERFKLLK